VVGSSHRLVAFEVGFHHAALVIGAAFVAGLVAQVDLHPRDVIAEMTQGTFDFASGPRRQCLMTFNMMISIDLDLHASLFANIRPHGVGQGEFYSWLEAANV